MVSQRQPPGGLIRAVIAFAMAAFLTLGLVGCAQGSSVAQPSWVHATESFAPGPPAARKNETVTIHLTDGSGAPLPGAIVDWSANMNMPGMIPAAAEMKDLGGGTYAGRTVLVMSGPWIASVEVQMGNKRATITIPFGVNE